MPASRPSLLRRIILRLTITTVVATVVAYGWLYLKASATATALRDRSLIEQASDIAAHLTLEPDGTVRLNLPARLAEAYSQSDGIYRYAVRDDRGQLVFSSARSIGPLPFFENDHHSLYDYDPDGPGPLHVFGAAVQTSVGGRSFVTQVEQAGSHAQYLAGSVTEEFITDGGWLGVPFLLTLLAVSILTVRQTLAPLSRLSRSASEIQPGKAQMRLDETEVPRELLPLVHAFNAALDRLDEGFRRQREFNANAAHQLRTPLAVLAANIDGLPDPEIAGKLRRDLDSMARIVSQLLVVARLEAVTIDFDEVVDLRAIALEAASSLGPLAIGAGKGIEVDEPPHPVFVRGNAWVILNALNNLVENAVAHTPPGRAVCVRVTEEPSIEVIDAGPGVPQQMREKIFERFWRGDRSRSGAGLGLAIVRRIMQALGGAVTVGDHAEGGAVFTLHFPAAGTAAPQPASRRAPPPRRAA